MTAPGPYDISIYRGDTKEFTLAITAGNPPGVPMAAVDLTGCTVAAQIRETFEAAQAALTFTCTITSAVGGLVLVAAAAAITALLTPGKKVWDLEITFPSGKKFTYLSGVVSVDPDVTRS